jgi:hypothetical protein|tara:strand:+ start:350 stop:499 length:150 start_codon:yes stop_codon:yes gene_type:complete
MAQRVAPQARGILLVVEIRVMRIIRHHANKKYWAHNKHKPQPDSFFEKG